MNAPTLLAGARRAFSSMPAKHATGALGGSSRSAAAGGGIDGPLGQLMMRHPILAKDVTSLLNTRQYEELVKVTSQSQHLSYGGVMNHFMTRGVPLNTTVRRKFLEVLLPK